MPIMETPLRPDWFHLNTSLVGFVNNKRVNLPVKKKITTGSKNPNADAVL